MFNFAEALTRRSTMTTTENGAPTHGTTLNPILDLFAIGGSARNLPDFQKLNLLDMAMAKDVELTLRTVFYLADVRGGAGERALFRLYINHLAKNYTEIMRPLIKHIPEFTRWDNLYSLVGTPLESEVGMLFRKEFEKSLRERKPSLMFKWLKSINTSSAESRKLGMWTAIQLGFERTPRGLNRYRKVLSRQRALLGDAVVERAMTAKKWVEINYPNVCSKAMLKNNKAFLRHDSQRFGKFVADAKSGKTKMNMGVTNPHEIVHKVLNGDRKEENFLETAWASLPNYINTEERILPIVDTSGSMGSGVDGKSLVRAIDVSIALGIYCAERLTGEFKNKVITFSREAKFLDITAKGQSLKAKANYLYRSQINETTNLQSVFDLLLETAILYKMPQNALPTKLIVISDMEFDNTQRTNYSGGHQTNFELIKEKFAKRGYKVPQLIFWNVCARNVQFPTTEEQKDVALVSGFNASMFKTILSGEVMTPTHTWLRTIGAERYNIISEELKGILN